jgi:L-serine dehydratase
MKAGIDFRNNIRTLPESLITKADSIEVRLFGSLSATGKGHGTDRAVTAGLLGHNPEECPIDFLENLFKSPNDSYSIELDNKTIALSGKDIIFDKVLHDYPFSNTLLIRLMEGKDVLFEREYYSLGGGFIQWKGWSETVIGEPLYKYENMAQLKELLSKHNLKLHELMLENEKAVTGKTEEEIYRRLENIVDVMNSNIKSGLNTEGILPGPIGLHRKAPMLYKHSKEMQNTQDRFLVTLDACAMAVAEENSAGSRVVTGPTFGSAGVIPAVMYIMKHFLDVSDEAILNGLLAAASFGFIAKHNASLASAEVGCQGEIGVASSMAAAMLAYGTGHGFQVTENAAETAMEHHLGLTCDPVGGYVQIPCIERNAMGAAKAYNSFLIAIAEVAMFHLVDFDKVIQAMAETGRDMSTKYKGTSKGGLAVSMVGC